MTEILTPLKCEEPVDVVFMVDGSDSVTARDWPIVLEVISKMKTGNNPQAVGIDS